MKNIVAIKIGLYAVFAIGLITFGTLFFGAYNAPHKPATNAATAPVQASGSGDSTDEKKTDDTQVNAQVVPHPHFMGYLSLTIAFGIGLGVLAAKDISDLIGTHGVDFVFNDDGVGQKDPDYEEAEQAAMKGNPLEAVQLLRDYLNKHPRRIYAALRIADLYESNLNNPRAASLEYEEILKQKLPAERWGWAAIHLANLYSGKLNETDKAVAILHRIVKEYGQTAAAKKARERLGISADEPVNAGPKLPSGFTARDKGERFNHNEPASVSLESSGETATEIEEESVDSTPAPSNLPPGFRPRNG